MGALSPVHLIIILVIALLVIGPGKLPEVGAALGKSIREFRKAATDLQGATAIPGPVSSPAPSLPPVPVTAEPIAAAGDGAPSGDRPRPVE